MRVEIQNSFIEVSLFYISASHAPLQHRFPFLSPTYSKRLHSFKYCTDTALMRDRDGWPGTLWANFKVLRMLGLLRPCLYPWAEQTPPTQGAHSLIRNNHSKDKSNK